MSRYRTYDAVDAPPPRPPRQTRNVAVRWKVTKAGTCLVCECGAASEPTPSASDTGHTAWLVEHIDRWHDPQPT